MPPPDLPWIQVDNDAPPIPFSEMGLDERLEKSFQSLGFEGTRPVQGAVIPLAIDGHDVVACAQTGTGKTLAFAVPILERLLSETPGYGDAEREAYTRALILAPTRELAVQIEDSLVGLTYHTPVTTAPIFGGVEMGPQERALQAGVDIIVATPGRLMDHMRHSTTDLVRVPDPCRRARARRFRRKPRPVLPVPRYCESGAVCPWRLLPYVRCPCCSLKQGQCRPAALGAGPFSPVLDQRLTLRFWLVQWPGGQVRSPR